ncbi:plasmid mobilization relaxosome protein MobC [Streptacidiphilus jiangxiensis]|uniref:Mobilisation protein (MobC) n=1 Tax=Streptacidiphilus jiangxiensis TaxID=235985 RepID=A0A1H7IXG2_STRJI|nr:plasmid mobilization relaxosome protein MobC [Streptacidiphilus jiangxiensis]SEK66350.1 mobilisation protein (MobC) [Streptacidiphilus jiangxiensis]
MSRNPFARKTRTTQAPPLSSLSTAQPPTLDRSFNGDGLPSTAERAGAKSTSPGGDADFALVPAPAGAGTAPAHGAGSGAVAEVGAERGLHQDQDQPSPAEPSEPADSAVVRLAPTISADAFVHRGIAAVDIPAPAHDDAVPGAARRRHLSDVLYRPRSGTKRSLQLTCSAEPAERDFIDLAARTAKRSRSMYLMDCALTFAHAYLSDQRPEGVAALPSPQATQDLMVLFGKLLREFGRIGNNLNQLVYAVHKGDLPDRAEEILDELHQVAQRARLLMDQALAGGGRRGA